MHPPFVMNNEILMHLHALKRTKKDVSLHDPIGQDKEGNEISLIDVLEIGKRRRHRHHPAQAQSLKKSKNTSPFWMAEKKKSSSAALALIGIKNKRIAKELGISRSPESEKRALMKIFHGFFRAEKEESLEKVIPQKPA